MDGCIGDLGRDDHLVLPSCSRAYLANASGLRCQTSIWIREPPAIQGRFYRWMPWLSRRFDHVLTYDPKTLASIDNGVFVAHGGCWIREPGLAGHEEKTGSTSIIAGPKRTTEGHRLRHRLIEWADANRLPLSCFGREYRPLDDKADALEPYRFSLVIENSRTPNYFTEKLIDSLVCMSLPIYWGDPNIASVFDPAGMLICRSEDELQSALATVNGDFYERRCAAVAHNRSVALDLTDSYQLACDALLNRPACNAGIASQAVRRSA